MAKAAWNRTIVDASGNVLPGADITVTDERTGTLATLFDDREGNDAKSNPFVADSNGFARFFADPGVYRVVAESGALSRTWRFQSLLDNALDITWTGEQEFTDKVTVDDELEVTGDVTIGGETTFNGELPQFTGMIAAFGTTTIPDGWLACNGATVPEASFPELYAVIGNEWDIGGEPSGEFRLPDLREAAPVGIGTRGTTAPDTYTLAQFKNDQMQRIEGSVVTDRVTIESVSGAFTRDFTTTIGADFGTRTGLREFKFNSANSTAAGGARTGDTTRGKRVGVQYCIKF